MTVAQKRLILDGAKVLIISLVLAGLIRWLVFLPFRVEGASMERNFFDRDYLIVDKVSSQFSDYQRGEVIVFQKNNTHLIKRIVGLPGETISVTSGSVYVNGELLDESVYLPAGRRYTRSEISISLEEGEYFVLGDNRSASSDSRRWGSLDKSDVVGRVFLRLLPIDNLKKF